MILNESTIVVFANNNEINPFKNIITIKNK